jgi:hypothetical protein
MQKHGTPEQESKTVSDILIIALMFFTVLPYALCGAGSYVKLMFGKQPKD